VCFPSSLQRTLEEVFQLSALWSQANRLGHLHFPYFIAKRDRKASGGRASREIILLATFNCFCSCFDRFNEPQVPSNSDIESPNLRFALSKMELGLAMFPICDFASAFYVPI
jgi:hypothetical protein